jgi:RES domain-containing protein
LITAWRLVNRRRVGDAFTGDGARRYGGRWNRRGTPVVYLADSLALAALEYFVHLGREAARLRFVYFRVAIPDDALEVLRPDDLPTNWRAEPPPRETMDLGSAWTRRARAAVLRVPSALVPVEFNYVLNPLHPDSRRVRHARPEPFHFDPRMWKKPIRAGA